MAEYKITVFRNDDVIFDKEVSPDAVIEFMRAVGDAPTPSEEISRGMVSSPAKKKGGYACSKCGEPGHRATTCGRPKKK